MDHQMLVSELQALAVETKRRNPEVKEVSGPRSIQHQEASLTVKAVDRALDLLKTSQPNTFLRSHIDDLLQPIILGCKTKVAKTIGISISALQRLVSLQGVPTAALGDVLSTLTSVANQAVDIQLKILQTVLSILTHNTDVHDETLGQALLLCFKLQDSRVPVVSSTAAATLRQAVMLVFDRISAPTEAASINLSLPTDPPTELHLTPYAMDAFSVLSDLCLLTAGVSSSSGFGGIFGASAGSDKEKPRLLKLSQLSRTLGLELVESVLGGYQDAIKQHPELLFLISHSLAPLLLKLQAERPTFPVALRVTRLIFTLIRWFTDQIPGEVEVFLALLIKLGTGDGETEDSKRETLPAWQRVLALEVLRAICGDSTLLQKLYLQYDGPDGPKIFAKMVSALGRLMNEKPHLLGVGTQMEGVGVPHTEATNGQGSLMDMSIGMMASAASVGVSTVSSMMGQTGGGLGAQSAPKLKLIDQHDKAEAPPIPETYAYLLALQALDSIAEGIHRAIAQATAAPPAVSGMAESAWPALLAALSFSMATNLSDALFVEVLSALRDFTVACGLLSLSTPRDAFISTLGKFAVPPPVVAAMQTYSEAPQAGSRSVSAMGAEALGLTALGVGGTTPTGPPSLSERNLACLNAIVATARILSASLGDAWHDILETLQNANFIIASQKPSFMRKGTPTTPLLDSTPRLRPSSDLGSGDRTPLQPDIDTESIQGAVNVLFDGTRELDDQAFGMFVAALTRLSSEMIGVTDPARHGGESQVDLLSPVMSPPLGSASDNGSMRRRASGLNVSQPIRSGERSFSLTKLRTVAMLNLERILSSDPSIAWIPITQHLVSVARHSTAMGSIRMQASETLAEILLSAVRFAENDERTQHQIFDVLVKQVDANPVSETITIDYDVRSAGFQTLHQILESSGHSLKVGWSLIFGMLNSVCKSQEALRRADSSLSVSSLPGTRVSSHHSKGDGVLVRIAFPSLTLICSDFLSSLDDTAMRQCIGCLGHFGRQREDVNITLSAIGLLWNVSDAVQGNGNTTLWLHLLSELLDLARDSRIEVRLGAMQTLFRCIELYGRGLSNDAWESILWKIVFPLLDGVEADETQTLALSSTGQIFGTFLPQMSRLESFDKVFHRVLERFKRSFSDAPRQCSTAALKALERILSSVDKASDRLLDAAWESFASMAESLSVASQPYTQENLIALVRVAAILHGRLAWSDERLRRLSLILRGIMTYSSSPDFRPDVDVMSPLQKAVLDLVAVSDQFSPSAIICDLSEFATLPYFGEAGPGKPSFVAVGKAAMPLLQDVFLQNARDLTLFTDGTVESLISAFAVPIKLKYDCPAPSKFGNDPPLWRTAMTCFAPVLEAIMLQAERDDIPADRYEAIWNQVIDVFAGIVLADASNQPLSELHEDDSFILPILDGFREAIVPRLGDPRVQDRILAYFGETLRKGSKLYDQDTRSGGSLAPVVGESRERMGYWAFGLLIVCALRHGPDVEGEASEANGLSAEERAERKIAAGTIGPLMMRIEATLRHILDDAALRGRVPFGRTREDEILYILRHLATMRVWPGTLQPNPKSRPLLQAAFTTSSRAHLFKLYPLLLELAFSRGPMPSMWLFPSERAQIFESTPGQGAHAKHGLAMNGDGHQGSNVAAGLSTGQEDDEILDQDGQDDGLVNAGDGADLIEVNAIDIARRCLELVGEEIGLA